MAQKDMAIIIGGTLLPKFTTINRIDTPNETDHTTLEGVMYTDFVNTRRAWKLTYKLITEEDYEIIKGLWFLQYQDEVYHTMQFDAYGIYTPVKITMSDQNIRYNGALIEDFSIILTEQYAVS